MNQSVEQKSHPPNPVSNASILSKLSFWYVFLREKPETSRWYCSFWSWCDQILWVRWLKSIFQTRNSREIDNSDIYAVTNGLRSDQNTEMFDKLWRLECKKKTPSLVRVILKVFGLKVFTISILFTIGSTILRWTKYLKIVTLFQVSRSDSYALPSRSQINSTDFLG